MPQPIAYLFRGVPAPRIDDSSWGITSILTPDKDIPVQWLGLAWKSLTRTPLAACGPSELLIGDHRPEAYEAPWPFPATQIHTDKMP